MKKQKPYDGPKINVDPGDVLNSYQAAHLLGVSDREVRAKIQRGTLPAIKIANKYYINRKAVLLYRHFCVLYRRSRKIAAKTKSSFSDTSNPQFAIDYLYISGENDNSHPYRALFKRNFHN